MKDILGAYYEDVKTNILDYLSTNSKHFTDRRVLKSIKLQIVDDSDEQSRYRQKNVFCEQIKASDERYDLKWLSILLLYLIDEDFQNVAYTLHKINYDSLPNEIVDKLDLLRRVSRLVYLYDGDKILDAMENLMRHPASDSISTSEILWEQYHYYDSEEVDYELLIEMANLIIKYHPNEYSSFFFLGYIFVQQEEFQKGLEAYSKALELCQADPVLYEQISWLYMRVADCQYNMKRHKDVIESTDHALQYYNKYNLGKENQLELMHFVYKIRCKSYFLQKSYQLALKDANLALEYCQQDNMEAMLGLKATIEKYC